MRRIHKNIEKARRCRNFRQETLILFVFFILGFFIHWLPNLKVPLHSDVSWLFRLQANKSVELQKAIPFGLKEMGAYSLKFTDFVKKWYSFTGRFNIIDLASFRIIAFLAGENPDIWRFIYIVFLNISVILFYLISRQLKIYNPLAIFLALNLYLYPLDIWLDYKTAEVKALLFFLACLYLAFKSNRLLISIISAIFMLLSVLSKENFVIFWPLIFVVIYMKNKFLYQVFPHIIAFLLLISLIVYLKFFIPMKSVGYLMSANNSRAPFFGFAVSYGRELLPAVFRLNAFSVWTFFFLLLFILVLVCKDSSVNTVLKRYFDRKKLTILVAMVIMILLHGLVYFFSNRSALGRYVVPANVLFALSLGLLTGPIFNKVLLPTIKRWWRYVLGFTFLFILSPYYHIQKELFLLVYIISIFTAYLYSKFYLRRVDDFKFKITLLTLFLILIFPIVSYVLKNAAQNRIDQDAWQLLINKVSRQAPIDGHVMLLFEEPRMIETAQSLEANTLLLGRFDLTYHLDIEDKTYLKENKAFFKFLIDSFNKKRKPLPENRNVYYVKADRKPKKVKRSALPFWEIVKVSIDNPRLFFYYLYQYDRVPYLNYETYLE